MMGTGQVTLGERGRGGSAVRPRDTRRRSGWRPAFARSLVPNQMGLTHDVDAYVRFYNEERAHTGRLTQGQTPLEALVGARKMRPR
jgi:hypothetical protein